MSHNVPHVQQNHTDGRVRDLCLPSTTERQPLESIATRVDLAGTRKPYPRRTFRHTFLSSIAFLCLINVLNAQTTRYVSAGASGSGGSWTNASGDLQLMINQSAAGDQVWVAAGTYKPNRQANNLGTISLANRNNAFVLKSGVKVIGGFEGTETSIAQRNLNHPDNASILSGDHAGNDGASFSNRSDNSYHVVISAGNVGAAELDGFTVEGGAFIVGSDANGSITVNTFSIQRGWGAGLYIRSSAPQLKNLVVRNHLTDWGAGILAEYTGSQFRVSSCTFQDNRATWGGGGFNFMATAVYSNVLIQGNHATSGGGGFGNCGSQTQYINCTIAKNHGGRGGGMYHYNSSTTTTHNTIVFGNTATTTVGPNWDRQVARDGDLAVVLYNCIFQDFVGGFNSNLNATGVTMTDLFANSNGNDFRLKAGSVAINTGSNALAAALTADRDGRARVVGANVDLGAFERSKLKKWDRGAGNDNWTDHANWVPDGIPLASDSVVLDHEYYGGNYTVVLHNIQTTVSSLRVQPTRGAYTILLNIPTTNTVADNLRITATGFNALSIHARGRITNRHAGATNVNSILVDGIAGHGVLLDTAGYYCHGTVTRDIPLLLNLEAKLNSTFEYDAPTMYNPMVFPLSSPITELRFHHLVFSGVSYGVTLAKDWDMYINGNLIVRTNAAFGIVRGSTTQAARTLHLRGNVAAIGTTNSTWVDASAPIGLGWNVIFDGSAHQTVTGNVAFLDRTEINNPSGLSVSGRFMLKSTFLYPNNPSLVLTSGVVRTTGTGLVQVQHMDPAKLNGHSVNSYIHGRLERSVGGTGTYDLPVGTATDYELATVNLTGITGATNLTAEFITSGLGSIAAPLYETGAVYDMLLDGGFWRVTPNVPVTGGQYSLSATVRGHTLADAPYYTLVKRSSVGDPWGLHGTYVSSLAVADRVRAVRSDFTSFSDFAIAYPSMVILPITLVDFDAYWLDGTRVQLEWATASETNNDHFTV